MGRQWLLIVAVTGGAGLATAAVRPAKPRDFLPVGWLRYDGCSDFKNLSQCSETRDTLAFSSLSENMVPEIAIPEDFEHWWKAYPLGRLMLSVTPLHHGDDPAKLASLLCGGAIELPGTVLYQGVALAPGEVPDIFNPGNANVVVGCETFFRLHINAELRRRKQDTTTMEKQLRRATSKPFICREDGSAHKFTVLGDSHARAFDLAAMRVGNEMSVNIVFGATLRGINNLDSGSGASAAFQAAMGKRHGTTLVLYLGDCDVHGVKWQEYLPSNTSGSSGVEKSLAALDAFLYQHAGAFSEVLVVSAPPVALREQHGHPSTPPDVFWRAYETASFDDRARSTADLNAHLRAFCLNGSRAAATPRCRFVDLTPTLVPAGYPAGRVPAGGEQRAAQPVDGVLRPYLNVLAPDIHLRFDRIYGQALEGLRAALGAKWCVDDAGSGDEVPEGKELEEEGEEERNERDRGAGFFASRLGFESVFLEALFVVDAAVTSVPFIAPRHVTARELSRALVFDPATTNYVASFMRSGGGGGGARGDDGAARFLELVGLFQRDEWSFQKLEASLVRGLGEGWGLTADIEVSPPWPLAGGDGAVAAAVAAGVVEVPESCESRERRESCRGCEDDCPASDEIRLLRLRVTALEAEVSRLAQLCAGGCGNVRQGNGGA